MQAERKVFPRPGPPMKMRLGEPGPKFFAYSRQVSSTRAMHSRGLSPVQGSGKASYQPRSKLSKLSCPPWSRPLSSCVSSRL